MRIRYLLGAALALAMVPGVAAAEENTASSCPECPSGSISGSTAQGSVAGTLDEHGNCVCPPSAEGSVGGSGSEWGADTQVPDTAEEGVGGAGQQGATGQEQSVTVIDADDQAQRERDEGDKGRMGLSVTANGGVEGYTSSLAPRINPGPAWGVTVGAMPTRWVGLELNYAGATNSVDDPVVGDADTRIVRNGGSANVRVNLLPTAIAPFVFGGVGINRASVSNEAGGYRDDTFGNIPLGAGLDWRIGNFTAGARFTFNYLFDREFTPPTQTGAFGFGDKQGGDIYNGQIQLGGIF